MKIEDLIVEVEKLKLHKQKKIGASLKKPLFLLLLISLIDQNKVKQNRFSFHLLEHELDMLIKSFGGRNYASRPEQPFNYLASSMIWEVRSPYGTGVIRDDKLSKKVLRNAETYGYFNEDVYELLHASEKNRAIVSSFILKKFWPDTIQQDIKNMLGLPEGIVPGLDYYDQRKRDPQFTIEVLSNYRNSCAVCGFSSVFNDTPFGIDAAHIMWHAYEGPDTKDNGLALCKLHHWALDRGIYTFQPRTYEITVSSQFRSSDNISSNLITNLAGKKLRSSQAGGPANEYIEWHHNNVFVK
ncbi:phosphorothioated DNA-binding restriction endonuclease [Salisediminibacterium beveridgei]|uniref:Uncharacterized protein n=1 Tax=Salisediminibacterium beveridgei TaxID=632773 RepID=A0A1D7QWZ3_9BACI|nr:HNH endonuclease [Salisediminibacterium beveridgei]AOM83533.1 hypothetical protein BBEV_2175 [Salisediminibacterium beveridgei]